MYRLVSRLANLGDRLVSDTGVSSEFGVLATQLTLRPTVQVTVVCVYRPPGVVSQLFCQHLADVLDQHVCKLLTPPSNGSSYAATSTVLELETAILTSTWRTCYSDTT